MQKLYCYVDESGADTRGRIYVVALPTFGDNRDEMRQACKEFERASNKYKRKWGGTRPERRLAYLQSIFTDKRFKGCLRYAVFYGKRDYDADTITAIANAIRFELAELEDYEVTVYVDAISSARGNQYTKELRKIGVQMRPIKSIAKDENEALIRLADAIAGFVRDILLGSLDMQGAKALYEKAKQNGYLIEL